jgi:hypothetical protein
VVDDDDTVVDDDDTVVDDDDTVADDDDTVVDDDDTVVDDDDTVVDDDDSAADTSCVDPSFSNSFLGGLDGASTLTSAAVSLTPLTFGASDFTIEFWVNPATIGAEQRVLNRSAGYPNAYWTVDLGADGSAQMEMRNDAQVSGTTSSSAGAVAAGVWQHVAISVDRAAGEVRYYIDGQAWGTASLPAGFLSAATNATGGFSLPGNTMPMTGMLDEVRVWSVARSEGQIQGGRCQTITTAPGLGFSMPFEADVHDHGPSGYSMVVQGNAELLTYEPVACATPGFSPAYMGGLTGFNYLTTAAGSLPELNFNLSDFSFEFWINPVINGEKRILSYAAGYPDSYWVVDMLGDGAVQMEMRAVGGVPGSIASNAGLLTAGVWQHIAVVVHRGPNTISFYKNGLLASSDTLPIAFAGVPMSGMGGLGVPGGVTPMSGALDEVRIWGRGLTDFDVANGMCQTLTSGANLLFSFPFDVDFNDRGPNLYYTAAVGLLLPTAH